VRRTLAGLLFGLAYACASLTIAGFLLQRVALDPSNSASAAGVVLADSAVRTEVVHLIADNVASQLKLDQATTRITVAKVAANPAGQKLLSQVIHDAHAHLVGVQKAPVRITGAELVSIARTQAASTLPPLTLPVPRIAVLDVTRQILRWALPIAGLATLVLLGLGFAAHPEKGALFRSLALGLLFLALMVAVLGYLVPKFLVPALSDSVWARVPALLADDSLPMLAGVELVLLAGAMGLMVGTGIVRRQRRWSTPVSTYRYNEERRWS
jgi:uncharacterized metal-binding protein